MSLKVSQSSGSHAKGSNSAPKKGDSEKANQVASSTLRRRTNVTSAEKVGAKAITSSDQSSSKSSASIKTETKANIVGTSALSNSSADKTNPVKSCWDRPDDFVYVEGSEKSSSSCLKSICGGCWPTPKEATDFFEADDSLTPLNPVVTNLIPKNNEKIRGSKDSQATSPKDVKMAIPEKKEESKKPMATNDPKSLESKSAHTKSSSSGSSSSSTTNNDPKFQVTEKTPKVDASKEKEKVSSIKMQISESKTKLSDVKVSKPTPPKEAPPSEVKVFQGKGPKESVPTVAKIPEEKTLNEPVITEAIVSKPIPIKEAAPLVAKISEEKTLNEPVATESIVSKPTPIKEAASLVAKIPEGKTAKEPVSAETVLMSEFLKDAPKNVEKAALVASNASEEVAPQHAEGEFSNELAANSTPPNFSAEVTHVAKNLGTEKVDEKLSEVGLPRESSTSSSTEIPAKVSALKSEEGKENVTQSPKALANKIGEAIVNKNVAPGIPVDPQNASPKTNDEVSTVASEIDGEEFGLFPTKESASFLEDEEDWEDFMNSPK